MQRPPPSLLRFPTSVLSPSASGLLFFLLAFAALAPARAQIEVNPGPERFRVLFVGNSITRHAPSPSLDWNQTSGMAADSAETDYAHRLRTVLAHALGRPTDAVIHAAGGGTVVHLLQTFPSVRTAFGDLAPDLVIVQVGENEPSATTDLDQLRLAYRDLLLQARDWPNRPLVVALGPWAPQTTGPPNAYDTGWVGAVETAFRSEADALAVPFLSVRTIAENPAHYGSGTHPAVQWHPSDAGHAAYARLLADTLLRPAAGLVAEGDAFARPNTPLTANTSPHPVGPAWLAPRGEWAVINQSLAARRVSGQAYSLALLRDAPLPDQPDDAARLAATVRVTDPDVSALAGLAFCITDSDTFYALRFSRPGLLQLVRITPSGTTALENRSVGGGRFDGPVRLALTRLGPGRFAWSATGPLGHHFSGEVTDPAPLPGRHVGLYSAVTAATDGTPRAFFDQISLRLPHASFLDRFERGLPALDQNYGPAFPDREDWRALDPHGLWRITTDRLAYRRHPSHTAGSILINQRAATSTPFVLRADLALSSDSSSRYTGVVFHASAPDTYYVLRYNLPGAVQLLRYRAGQLTLLENRSIGSGRLLGRVAVRVESTEPGRFVWSLHDARGQLITQRTTLDPLPLRGGRAGIFANVLVTGDTDTVHCHRFSLNPAPAVVTVELDAAPGHDRRDLLGQLILGADPTGVYFASSTPIRFSTRHGDGIWNPNTNSPEPATLALLRSYRPGVLRYPDGLGVHGHDWRHTVGPIVPGGTDRRSRDFRFGLPEFLRLAAEVGADPVIVVSEYTGTPDVAASAADLVAYLNAPLSTGHPMALLRAADGRNEPWDVRYFEIGNESWVDYRLAANEVVPPAAVAERAAAMIAAMKAIDPTIVCGLPYDVENRAWSEAVFTRAFQFTAAQGRPDFAILHVYPVNYGGQNLALQNDGTSAWLEDRLLQTTLLSGLAGWHAVSDSLAYLRSLPGAPAAYPVAVTEYNTGFAQSGVPHAYRFSLAAGLGMADFAARMAESDSVLFAMYWQWLNGFWGPVRHANLSSLLFNYSAPQNFPLVIESLRAPHHVFAALGEVVAGQRLPVSTAAPRLVAEGFGRSDPTALSPPATPARRSSRNLVVNTANRTNFINQPDPPPAGLTTSTSGDHQLNFHFANYAPVNSAPGVATIAYDAPGNFAPFPPELRPPSPGLLYRVRLEARWEPAAGQTVTPTLGFQINEIEGFVATGTATVQRNLQDALNSWQTFELTYRPRPDSTGLIFLAPVTNPAGSLSGTLRLRNLVVEAWDAPALPAPPAVTALASRRRADDGTPFLEIALLHLSDFEHRHIELRLPGLPDTPATLRLLAADAPAAYRVASEQDPAAPDPGGALLVGDPAPTAVSNSSLHLTLPPHSLARLTIPLPDARPAYQRWLDAAFGFLATDDPARADDTWGPRADPHRTGVPNLLAYALGRAPDDRMPLPLLHHTPGSPAPVDLRFHRAAADLDYRVESSPDLATWTLHTLNPGQVGEDVTVPFPPGPRQFLRLRVELR